MEVAALVNILIEMLGNIFITLLSSICEKHAAGERVLYIKLKNKL